VRQGGGRPQETNAQRKQRLRAWTLRDSLASISSGMLIGGSSMQLSQQSGSVQDEAPDRSTLDLEAGDQSAFMGVAVEAMMMPLPTKDSEPDLAHAADTSCYSQNGPRPRAVSDKILKFDGKRVLIVDDVLSNRKLLRNHMRKLFSHIDEAEDGAQAVACVKRAVEQRRDYDVIFMDFVMPNMDGPTATAEIRGLGYVGAVFGVTGNALTSDIQLFIERGANNVFLKPVDMVVLDRELEGKEEPYAIPTISDMRPRLMSLFVL